jgi:dephospho-CoA kinase
VVICDVPLLVESKAAAARPYVAVVVVEAPLDVRLARLELRGVPRDDAERRMAAQATDEERRAVATFVLDNRGDRESLARQVDAIWPELLTREPPEPPTPETAEPGPAADDTAQE